jgi:hypothetical protein
VTADAHGANASHRRWYVLGAVGVAAGVALATASLALGLNGDVQYVLGALRVHDGGHFTAFIDTFAHRPIAYRAILGAMAKLASVLGVGEGDLGSFEVLMRLMGIALSVATAATLIRALQGRIGRAEAWTIGVAVALSLGLAANWDFLQAEWFATLFVALSVAAALGPSRTLPATVLGGLCVVLVIAVKLSTAPLSLLALLLVAMLDLRRALLVAAAAVGWAIVWLLVCLATPMELTWMRDMIALNPESPLRTGFGVAQLGSTLDVLGSKAALAPWIALTPAAVVLLTRTVATARRRLLVSLSCTAALLLAVAPLVVQGQWWLYHLGGLPPLAAALVALAVVRWWRATGHLPLFLVVALPAISLAMTAALSMSVEWRAAQGGSVMNGLAVVAAALGVWAAATARPSPPWAAPAPPAFRAVLALGLGILLAFAPALVPMCGWSLDPNIVSYSNEGWASLESKDRAGLERLSARIGRRVPVVYLAYGDVAYHMGNPTACRYPSPLWLQRGVWYPYLRSFASYRDNVECITRPGSAEYLILQPGWLNPGRLQPEVQSAISTEFDCEAAVSSGEVVVCPRRH